MAQTKSVCLQCRRPSLIPGRSPGEGNGNSRRYSGLENSMGRGAWWAIATNTHTRVTSTYSIVLFACGSCPQAPLALKGSDLVLRLWISFRLLSPPSTLQLLRKQNFSFLALSPAISQGLHEFPCESPAPYSFLQGNAPPAMGHGF